jgi:hypothetical protein
MKKLFKKASNIAVAATLITTVGCGNSTGVFVGQPQSNDNQNNNDTSTTTVTLQNGEQVQADNTPDINQVEIIGQLSNSDTVAHTNADIKVPNNQTADDLTFYTSGELSAQHLEGARNYIEAGYADIQGVLGNDMEVHVTTGARVHNIEGNNGTYATIGNSVGASIAITTTPQGTGTKIFAPNTIFNDGSGNETTVTASLGNGHKGVVNVGRDIGFENEIIGAREVFAQSAACDFVMHGGGQNATLNIGSLSTGYTTHQIGNNDKMISIGQLTNNGQVDYPNCYTLR